MAFDLSSIDIVADSERGSWLHLKDPRTGKPIMERKETPAEDGGDPVVTMLPVRIHVLGPHAKAVQAATEQISKDRQKREAERTVTSADGKVVTKGESTKEELAEDNAKLYAAATIGWENLAFEDCDKFSADLVKRMYIAREWAGTQVYWWMLNHANFIDGQEND